MNRNHFVLAASCFCLVAALVACGGGGNSSTGSSTGSVPTPAPTPVPTPTPNPFAAACGTPLPPMDKAYGFNVKVQLEPTRNKKILNASPLVRDTEYCLAAIGINAVFCSTRREDNPQRPACDHYMSGISSTGKAGPNWFQVINGVDVPCGFEGQGGNKAPDCFLKEENQYLIDVYRGGQFRACGGTGGTTTCGVCILTEDDFGVIHNSPAGLCDSD